MYYRTEYFEEPKYSICPHIEANIKKDYPQSGEIEEEIKIKCLLCNKKYILKLNIN